MKRILSTVLAALLVANPLLAATVYSGASYGVAATFDFELYNSDGTLDVDEADGGTEVELSCDGGAYTTATNDFVDEGHTYSIALTAAEMACDRIAVSIGATDRGAFFIRTVDPDVSVRGLAQAGASGTVTLPAAASATDDYYVGQLVGITTGTGAQQARKITDYNGTTKVATIGPNWATTPSTDSMLKVYRIAPGVPGEFCADFGFTGCDLDAALADIASDTAAAGSAVSAILGTPSGASVSADILTLDNFIDTEIAAILALLDDARTEPGQGAPPVNPDLATKIDYLYKAWRNRSTQTATQYSLYDNAGTTVDQKASFSDNGTTADRGEIATGP